MIWADRIAEELKGKQQHVDDMFTPSGFAHVGSLRGPILHDVVSRVFKEQDKNTVFTYVFNDFDPIDGLPPELMEKSSPYLGYPLRLAPSPYEGCDSFADYFASDFKSVLESLGVSATYLSSWDMYHEGKFNTAIKIALDHGPKILEVYKKVAGYQKKTSDWHPLQVICPQCKKLGTTKVTGWDGKKVQFTCEPHLVSWAEGCGHTGEISPFDGSAKLPWKVDWPAHWQVLGVTFEGAGKDHASRGGSYDIAFALCDEVFHYPKPYYFPYEFFLFGGKKMSSSKGIGLKGRDLTSILPPELARFLVVRTIPQKALEFNPEDMTIPDLFDEFDRCAHAYWSKKDADLGRIFELSQVNSLYKTHMYLPRFRQVAARMQMPSVNMQAQEGKAKGGILTTDEKKVLAQRVQYAKIWLETYAPEDQKFSIRESIPSEVSQLTKNQKIFLSQVVTHLAKATDPEALQMALFEEAKRHNLSTKDAFQSIYVAILGKPFGPKAGWLLHSLDERFVHQRFTRDIESFEKGKSEQSAPALFPNFSQKEIFSIDPKVRRTFPSITVGIAIVKGVKIGHDSPMLKKQTEEILAMVKDIKTEDIGNFPEIQSYRQIYRAMKVDWHSRRPSPEALLRRIVSDKGVYHINTCVDAVNLTVLKRRVSVGVFDLSKIQMPTVLRYARPGEKILLLGEAEPTPYASLEIGYFDRQGGYNIDFNYRDAQRTSVTAETRDIFINVDGVYDISRESVELVMRETIDSIKAICGGTLELAGIIEASK